MNSELVIILTQNAELLNEAARARSLVKIAKCYKRINVTLNKIYQTDDVTTALSVEKVLIASEQNDISKAANTYRTITEHLGKIARAEAAAAVQEKNPKTYHQTVLLGHALKHCRDGTAFDVIRATLADCRKLAKDQITARKAEILEEKRESDILRHGGLANAERAYIERQAEYQEENASPETRKQMKQNCLKSFDAKLKHEQRQLTLT